MSAFVKITDYPAYEINVSGEVRRILQSGETRILKPFSNGHHYLVRLYNDLGSRCVRVHRLVMQTFGPAEPAGKPLVLHRDDNAANNHLCNLLWGDKRENAVMASMNGCLSSPKHYITWSEAGTIRARYNAGLSMAKIATEIGCSRWTVSNIVHDRVARVSEVRA